MDTHAKFSQILRSEDAVVHLPCNLVAVARGISVPCSRPCNIPSSTPTSNFHINKYHLRTNSPILRLPFSPMCTWHARPCKSLICSSLHSSDATDQHVQRTPQSLTLNTASARRKLCPFTDCLHHQETPHRGVVTKICRGRCCARIDPLSPQLPNFALATMWGALAQCET